MQFASIGNIKKAPMVNVQSPPKKSVKPWKPKLVKSLVANKKELENVIANPSNKKVFIIDARSKEEYFNRRDMGGNYQYPDINAIHISWDKFIGENGRPNFKIKSRLVELGIKLNSRVIIITQQGLRSAAVTASLTLMGFTNVGNFTGGYKLLFPRR